MKHHYIPQFYQKQWCDGDGMLWRYARHGGGGMSCKRLFPSAVGYQLDLYRLPIEQGVGSQQLETNFFQVLDGLAAEALLELVDANARALPLRPLSTWIQFMLSLFYRSPAYLEGYIGAGREQLQHVLGIISEADYQEKRAATDPETLAEYVAGISDDEAAYRTMRLLPYSVTRNNILEAFGRLNWIRVQTPSHCPDILLSDDPLMRSNGLHTYGGYVATPLGPRQLLIGTHEREMAESIAAADPVKLVRDANTWIVEGARHFVAARDQRQTRFIANRFGRNPKTPLMTPEGAVRSRARKGSAANGGEGL